MVIIIDNDLIRPFDGFVLSRMRGFFIFLVVFFYLLLGSSVV